MCRMGKQYTCVCACCFVRATSSSAAHHTSTRAALDLYARCRALGSTTCGSTRAGVRGRTRPGRGAVRCVRDVCDAARDRIDDRAPVSGVCVDVGVGWRAGGRGCERVGVGVGGVGVGGVGVVGGDGDATGDVFDARGVDAKVFDDVRAGRDVGGAERGECDDGGV